jgi:small conductance mechanosensitive channel
MDLSAFMANAKEWVFMTGPSVALVVALAMAALKLAGVVSRRVFTAIAARAKDAEAQKRADTLGSVVKYILGVVIMAVAFMMLLKELGIDIGPILAAAGIVGLAVGFGAQQLVQDVISGFFILLEDQIRVGDVVVLGDKGGIVEKVNLRMTILRDLAGNVHFIRNGQIGTVTNMTKEFSRYVFEVGVAYREDVDEVMEVIREVDEGMRGDPEYSGDILEPIEILGLDKFADSAVVIKARTKTKTMQQWRVGREFNRRLKKAFDERNIEIPFPHSTVYMGQDKAGASPPLNVRMRGEES